MILFLFAFLSLTSCFPFDEGEEIKIIGNYYARGSIGLENVHIGYEDSQYGGIGLLTEPITAIGHNNDYIIAKRIAIKDEYFIIKVVGSGIHHEAEKAIIGPLGKKDFNQKLKQLGLSHSLRFDMEFPENKSW